MFVFLALDIEKRKTRTSFAYISDSIRGFKVAIIITPQLL